MSYILSVLVYARCDDEVLVMQRNKEPNLGLWVAPGGKVEVGESPYETACREMREETGLVVEDLRLRGFCTEVSPSPDWHWMLFIYVTRTFRGDLCADRREGDLAWMARARYLNAVPIPQADAVFAPRVLRPGAEVFQAKFVYDAELKLTQWIAY